MKPPILVTGSHRSGTTWVGRLLAAAEGVGYVHEPMNAELFPSPGGGVASRWYEYLPPDGAAWRAIDRSVSLRYPLIMNLRNSSGLRQTAQSTKHWAEARLTWRRASRAVIKDPFLLFNATDFAHRYEAPVIVCMRGPEGFVDSLLRNDWRFDFRDLAEQSRLIDGTLAPYADEITRAAEHPLGPVEEACLLWRVLNGAILDLRNTNPRVHLLRYEALAADPHNAIESLYATVGLAYDDAAAARLRPHLQQADGPLTSVVDTRRDPATAAAAWRSSITAELASRIIDLTEPEHGALNELQVEDGWRIR